MLEKRLLVRISPNLTGWLLLSGLALSLTACGPSNQELAATIIAQTAVARELETVAVARALSDALTANAPAGSPVVLAPTLTATLTGDATASGAPQATAIVPYGEVEVAVSSAAVRAGPGQEFLPLLSAGEGQRLAVAGATEDGQWLAVILEDDELGWVLRRQVIPLGDISQIPVMAAPTLAPPVIITIINRLNVTIFLRVTGIEQSLSAVPGETEAMALRPGTYEIRLAANNPSTFELIYVCEEFTYEVIENITWVPRLDTFCEIFP